MRPEVHQKLDLDLGVFRKRIASLRSFRQAAIGGSIGVCLALLAIACDRLNLWNTRPELLFILVGLGIICGAISGFLANYSDEQIARSIDRRSLLDDRLATVFERGDTLSPGSHFFLDAVSQDTAPRLEKLDVQRLYPFRITSVHALFLVLAVSCCLLYLAFETTLFLPVSARIERDKMARAAVVVEQVAKPLLDQADRPGASPADKQLASGVRKFVQDLSRGRMTKQEALIRANELADQARQLTLAHNFALGQSLKTAESAGSRLQEMAQNSSLQKTDEAKMADEASSLERQMSSMQNQLDAARAGRANLTKSEMAALQQKLAEMQQKLQQIKLSQQAAEMLSKLHSMPEYQQAMALLSMLQTESDLRAKGESSMSAEQMQAVADQLDALAKEMDTDAKLKAYAQSLLEAAMAAQATDAAGLAGALQNAFSLGERSSCDAPPDFGENGTGSTSPGTWVGNYGKLNLSDKSSLLHLNFQDRIITSQIGHNGPETYTEEMGPAHLDNRSDVPYQAMLPKYEKSAESALSKGDIPPEMRTKVRDYFDSLHGNN